MITLFDIGLYLVPIVFIAWLYYKRSGAMTLIKRQEAIQGMSYLQSENDKLIIVENMAHGDLLEILAVFCRDHQHQSPLISLKVVDLGQDRFAILFPLNIEFLNLCFLVNYLHYPPEALKPGKIFAWATLGSNNGWFEESLTGKQTILFVPSEDTEYDNVFATTEDNQGFRLSFTRSKAQLLPTPKEVFVAAPLSAKALLVMEGEIVP